MQRKGPASVIAIDSARRGPEPPTIPPSNSSALRKNGRGFVLNAHTRRQFLALVFGPLAYSLNDAAKAANHNKRDGWEQIVNMGRREWERRSRGVAA